MKTYDSCFTGADAVEVVYQRLQAEKMNFSKDVSRDKAVKVGFLFFIFTFIQRNTLLQTRTTKSRHTLTRFQQNYQVICDSNLWQVQTDVIVTTVPLAVGYGALNLSVRSLDR